jgi:hypothetical protein
MQVESRDDETERGHADPDYRLLQRLRKFQQPKYRMIVTEMPVSITIRAARRRRSSSSPALYFRTIRRLELLEEAPEARLGALFIIAGLANGPLPVPSERHAGNALPNIGRPLREVSFDASS